MRSLDRLGSLPASLPLLADDVVEFHAARLMLLMQICGIKGRIDGLTKMAKLDFFVRYPDFFEAARASILKSQDLSPSDQATPDDRVESAMVRHHYGPWDKRYYHVLAHLEARSLIAVSKEGKTYRIALTTLGAQRAATLAKLPSFAPLTARMKEVKRVFGSKTGTSLKDLIYRLFEKEVGKRPMGERISI